MNEVEQQELNEQLFAAAHDNKLEKVKELIKAGAEVHSKPIITCGTALHVSAEKGHIETMSILIAAGADVNYKCDHCYTNDWASSSNNYGVTPLYIAVQTRQNNAILFLLEKGARTDIANRKKITPLKCIVDYFRLIEFYEPMEKTNVKLIAETAVKYTVLRNPGIKKPKYIISNAELSEHWDKCLEMEKMQHEILGNSNSNVSFYQFLSETDKNKLADYLSNESTGVREELKGGLYTERYHWIYPLCASMIESQYDKGMERRELLSGCEQFFKKDSSGILSGDLAYELAKKVVDSKVMKADVEKFMRSKGQEVA